MKLELEQELESQLEHTLLPTSHAVNPLLSPPGLGGLTGAH